MLTNADNSSGDAVLPKVVLSIVICILGLFGNLIAMLLIIVLKEYKKSVTHWYILNLALADSIFLLTLPFKVSQDLNNAWIYPEWTCKGKETIMFLNYYASILFLVLMSVDRYIAVCHTFSQNVQALRKPRNAVYITLVMWVLSLLFCIPVMMYTAKSGKDPFCKCSYVFPKENELNCANQGLTGSDLETCEVAAAFHSSDEKHCRDFILSTQPGSEDYDETGTENNETEIASDEFNSSCHYGSFSPGWTAFLLFNFLVMFILPLVVMVTCYSLIISKLTASRMRVSSSSSTVSFTVSGVRSHDAKRKLSNRSTKDRKRVTIMCSVLVSSFVVCWLPFHAVHLAKLVGIPGTKARVCERLSVVGTMLAFLNSAINPYLYSFLGSNFPKRWTMFKNSRGVRYIVGYVPGTRRESTGSSRQSKLDRNRSTLRRSQKTQQQLMAEESETKNQAVSPTEKMTIQEETVSNEQSNVFESETMKDDQKTIA